VIRRKGVVAVLDGDAGLGQVVGHAAMQLATEIAHELSCGVVAVRHSSHFGIGALFVEQAVAQGLIGIALTNAPANMPPHGGRQRFFGTNPLAIGIPCASEPPVVLDMSTSVVARGKIVMLQKLGLPVPAGWAIDPEGHPTEDTAAALAGCVLPMSGHKGSGLAGAASGPQIVDLYDTGDQPQNVGHFFLALSVDAFMPLGEFGAHMDQVVREVRSQPRQAGVERIYVPGEWEYELAERSKAQGITLPAAGVRELDALANRVGVKLLSERVAVAPGYDKALSGELL
jgi:LDH2 family malate/lactate/ureidoglycolate dehydrogenase